MTESLYTVDQVAEIVGLKRATIYSLVREGKIPHIRLGRAVRFRPASIEEWLRDSESR